MAKPLKKINRRVFLRETAVITLFGSSGMIGRTAPVWAGERSGKRKLLATPSPMIPPVPAILLTVNGEKDIRDEITVVWTFVINSKPPQVGISVHKQHVALGLIRKHGQFVLNVPTADMAEQFDMVDMNSKKALDKFSLTGLTREKAVKVNAPAIKESPIHVECRVFDEIAVPPVRTMFLADVLATAVHEHVCDENGRLIVASTPFFGMTPGSGEFYTMGKLVGHIGQSLDKDDIKY